ncbi:MAG: retropepsin-like domain-containing protein, partial [Marinobacterium sp.]|nr:retropepsin-like domain-containing protein [Marinobacterium sp.]
MAVPRILPDFDELVLQKDNLDWYRSPTVRARLPELDVEFRALIDSGADIDIISGQLMHKIQLQLDGSGEEPRERRLPNGATALVYENAQVAVITDVVKKKIILPNGNVMTTDQHVVMSYDLLDAWEKDSEWMSVYGSHSFVVLPNTAHDCILGSPWLSRYNVKMDFGRGRLVAYSGPSVLPGSLNETTSLGGGMIRWLIGDDEPKAKEREIRDDEPQPWPDTSDDEDEGGVNRHEIAAAMDASELISGSEYLRLAAMQEKTDNDVQCFVIYVREENAGGGYAPDHPRGKKLCEEFADLFPDELPDGLPPEERQKHRIVLTDDAKPVAR